MSGSKPQLFMIVGIIIGGVIGAGAIYLKSTNDTMGYRLEIQEHINTIQEHRLTINELEMNIQSLEANLDEQTEINVELEKQNLENKSQIENLLKMREELIAGYNERIDGLSDSLSNMYQNYFIAQDGYGDAAAECVYDLGYRGCIMLFNASSNTSGDFVTKFEELGGTMLFPNEDASGGDMFHEYARTNNLDNANFFAQAYTTETEYSNWYWIPREGFNENNVMLVTFGLSENIDIYYYNGIQYSYLASLPRIDLLNRYPPDH